MRRASLLGLFLSFAAMANDKVQLETPVAYAASASVIAKVKSECEVEAMLEKSIAAALLKSNRNTIAQGADADAQVLRVSIENVMGVGGGAYSGPKSITVNAEMLQNGKVIRQTRLNRWSMGGVFGGFKGTCSILNRCAVAIGSDLARWSSDANYVIKNTPPPAAEASAVQAE